MKSLTDDWLIQLLFEHARSAMKQGRLELSEDIVSVATAHEPTLAAMTQSFRDRWQLHVSDYIASSTAKPEAAPYGHLSEGNVTPFLKRMPADATQVATRYRAVIVGCSAEESLFFSDLLDEFRFNATFFDDHVAALDFIETFGAEMVICDTCNDAFDGTAFLKDLREMEERNNLPKTKAVAMTYGEQLGPAEPLASQDDYKAYLIRPLTKGSVTAVLSLLSL